MPDSQNILDGYNEQDFPPPSAESEEIDRRMWAVGVVTDLTDTHYLHPNRVADHVVVHAAIILDFVEGRIDRNGHRTVPVSEPAAVPTASIN